MKIRDVEPGVATARVLVAGDLYVGHGAGSDAGAPWPTLIDMIREHDLAVVNLECPLTSTHSPIAKWGPHLRGAPEVAGTLRTGGFHLAALANNHILDMGGVGVMDTLRALDDAGVAHVGAGLCLADATASFHTVLNGVSIAVLAMAENEFSIAGPSSPGAAPFDLAHGLGQVSVLSKDVDVVVALVHGGSEYYPLPSPRMAAACRALADAGADCVVCSHTHVVGPYEVYGGAPIVYGTGNFLFQLSGPHPQGWNEGLVFSVVVDREGVTEFSLTATVQTPGGGEVRAMTEGEKAEFSFNYDSLVATVGDPDKLNDEWLQFCQGQRTRYLGALLGMNRLERALLRMEVWPPWRRRARIREMLNHLRCEAHADVGIEVLERELRGW